MTLRLKFMIQRLIWAFTKRILGPHVSALVVKSANVLFAVDPEDFGVGRDLRKSGKYGLDEMEKLRPYLTSASRVLIVGAHVGTLAIPMSKLCEEVVALEANPATYDLLVMNIALNSASNCRAINIAASDKEEHIEFLLNRANSGGSKRVPKVYKYAYYYDKPKNISVKAVPLDEYLAGERFDIVVMDIEGSEYFALRGMKKILSRCQLLMVEFLPQHLKDVSGVTVEQFVSVIAPHFSRLTIPSKRQKVPAVGFVDQLTAMYNLDQGDAGILFEKM